MTRANNLPRLLEIELPGIWIAKHRHIWQMNLLNANNFARFSSDRGLSSFSEEDVTQLWQLRLIKADIVLSRRKIDRVGLVDHGINKDGYHMYSDERQFRQSPKGWKNARETVKPLRSDIELLFHPFRYYVLNNIDRVLSLHSSRMQMLYQDGYQRVLDICLSMFNKWAHSSEFVPRINTWNDIASLAIVTEPCTYERIFRSIHFSLADVDSMDTGAEQIHQQIIEYWKEDVFGLYQRIGKERLEEIRQELCVATQMLDSNRWVHTLLCLGKGNLRIELKDHLGGALVLRTMAEMIRRATEKAFDVLLREEDELGLGWMPEGVKAKVYGSNRLLDGDENVAREFMRQFELHYGLRLRFYVEGATEWAALHSFFQRIGARYIDVINLRGEVAQKGGRGVTFRENLRSDINMHVFSMVLIDDDRSDFVSAVKKAAKDDEICGCFFISKKDFEFANFDLSELEEVLWRIASEDSENIPVDEDQQKLHDAIKNAQNAEELIKQARRSLPQLAHLYKGELWGEKLIEFAWENPLRQGKERQVIKAIQIAVTTRTSSYEGTRRGYRVDESTGQLIKRDSVTP